MCIYMCVLVYACVCAYSQYTHTCIYTYIYTVTLSGHAQHVVVEQSVARLYLNKPFRCSVVNLQLLILSTDIYNTVCLEYQPTSLVPRFLPPQAIIPRVTIDPPERKVEGEG